MEKVIALVDCNSFYCSCERLFRPDLLKTPIGVLSNNDGCFVSRTNELKALGVKMGEPYFKVKELCEKNNVAVFSANFSLYTNISDRVMRTLINFAPIVEVYSVDEAFLDLTGIQGNIEEYCREIRETILRNVGIPVSIGIANTKTLSKVANKIAKNYDKLGGVFHLSSRERIEWSLEKTKVEDIWGIGRRSSEKLNGLGVYNAKQFRDYKNERQIQKIFTKVGRRTQDELKGKTCLELNTIVEKKKEIISSRTFGAPVFDLKSLRESIANYATLASEKLRLQDSVCASIEVVVRTNPYKNVSQYYAAKGHRFNCHTNDTRTIIKYAWRVLDELFQQGFEYKKGMVRISGIRDGDQCQLSLFENSNIDKSKKLMEVIDRINRREGPQTIKSMACGVDSRAWKMRQDMKSPRYVTGWNNLKKCY
tara:strand:+ start:9502 stop:10770 length:1269 start_codon:yes stop_codon:yes gene_type:complete